MHPLRRALFIPVLVIGGCVTAYDPQEKTQASGDANSGKETAAPRATPAPSRLGAYPQDVLGLEAAPDTPAGRKLIWFLRVLAGAPLDNLENRFAPEFLAQVPPASLEQVTAEYRKNQLSNGPVELVRIEIGATDSALVAMVRAPATDRFTRLSLSVEPGETGRIQGLLLTPLVGLGSRAAKTWEEFDSAVSQLSGRVSFGVYEVPADDPMALKPIHTLDSDARLAIGSTFKLYILGALAQEVAAGRANWDEPLAVSNELKSLPSGILQNEAPGTQFPIAHFADLMISISDNTGADHLLARVGRERVEEYMAGLHGDPDRNRPFLSTLELFKLKLSGDPALASNYAAADLEARRAMLAPGGAVAAATPNLVMASLWLKPNRIESLEWFASAEECCRLMADLHRMEQLPGQEALGHALRINPGLGFDTSTWTQVAFKGGSEPGVLNMTWLFTRSDGRTYAMSLGWNDPNAALEEAKVIDLVGTAVARLARP